MKERCTQCAGKLIYLTWAHAANDANQLNRKQRSPGKVEPYRGPCGHWHVGRSAKAEERRNRNRRNAQKRRKWNWRDQRF